MARRTTLSPVLVAIVLVPVLTACETTGSSSLFALAPEVGSERSQAEKALLAEKDEIVMRSAFQGALIGSAVGCGVGLIFGDPTDCLIGAGVGLLAGGVSGAIVGEGNASAAQAEYDEAQLIAALQTQEEGLVQMEANLNRALAEQRRRLDDLDRRLAAGEIDEATVRRQQADMREVRSDVVATLEQEKAERESLDVQLTSWTQSGLDVSAVETRNDANLQRIDRLLSVANSFDPASV